MNPLYSSELTKYTRRELARRGALLAAMPAFPAVVTAQPAAPRNLLRNAYSAERIAEALLPREKWRPYPTVDDRAAWEALPASTRAAFIQAGERNLTSEWPALSATLLLDYARTGGRADDRVRSLRRAKLRALMMAEVVGDKGRFLEEALNGVWSTCEETFLGASAHLNWQKAGFGLPDVQEPTVDIFSGEAGVLLGWTLYFLGSRFDKISPLIRERIHYEVERRILTPCLEGDLHWMHYSNNWNVWCNTSWLICNLLLERDEKRRRTATLKSLRNTDNFLNNHPGDGGCFEGTSYWAEAGGRLIEYLEMLDSATHGAGALWKVPLIGEIGRFIYRVHIDGDWFTNPGDGHAKTRVDGSLVYRYGWLIRDEKLMEFGKWLIQRSGQPIQDLQMLFTVPAKEFDATPARTPQPRDVWLKDNQLMVARRQAGSGKGFFLAAFGGNNGEPHSHNDVGSFIVFYNGEPVAIDPGVGAYTRQAFDMKERYTIWTFQSAYHNLPTVGGVMQAAGRPYQANPNAAYHADDSRAELSMEIAKAYPPTAGVESWLRTYRLDRVRDRVEIEDRYALNRTVSDITLTLMTARPIRKRDPGTLLLEMPQGNLTVSYEGPAEVSIEEMPLTDASLSRDWGGKLWRVLFRSPRPPAQGNWKLSFSP